jgi:hypothetical protein
VQRKHASWLRALLSALAGVLAGSCTELPPSPAPLCDDGSACRDSDCDFICDLSEGIDRNRDSDRDGMPDYLDTDSDGDGIRDRDEAGDEDRLTPPVDRDENGLEDYLDPQYPLHFRPQKPDASQEAEPAPERDAAMSGAIPACARPRRSRNPSAQKTSAAPRSATAWTTTATGAWTTTWCVHARSAPLAAASSVRTRAAT